MRLVRIIVPTTVALLAVASTSVRAQEARTVTGAGLHTATFQTPQGRVVVRLPDDMAAGDVISGTVMAEPEGRSDRDRQRASDELNGYVVEVDQARTPVSGRVLRWTVPAALAGGVAVAVLRDPSGHEVARTQVPVARTAPPPPNDTPRPGSWQLPRIGQQGRPLEIPGPFDGSFDNTSVRVGGQTAAPLAESPRKVVVESPREVTGPTQIELREGEGTANGPYRSVGVHLAAPRTNLLRGERTTLTVQVTGLEGLDSALALRLENRTPSVVGMDGGDRQTVSIAPGDVAAGGQYTTTRTLTGAQTGAFQVAATLAVPGALLAAHVWNISPAPHTPNVTTPPTHWYRFTFSPHQPDKTWSTQSGGKWADHTPAITFGPPGAVHVPRESWGHVTGITRWRHYEGITYDGPHVPRITWQPSHTENFSFSEHIDGASFPPHQQTGSWAPRHQERVSWPPAHKDGVTWPPEHKSNYSWPDNHQASTTNWTGPPYREGLPLPKAP